MKEALKSGGAHAFKGTIACKRALCKLKGALCIQICEKVEARAPCATRVSTAMKGAVRYTYNYFMVCFCRMF